MVEELKKVEIQKVDKDGFDATVRSFGEMSNSFQAIATEVADYSSYDTYVAEMPKLGEMYVAIARDASKPVKQVFSNKGA